MKIFQGNGQTTSLSQYTLVVSSKKKYERSAANKAQLDRHMALQESLATFAELDEWQAKFIHLLLGDFKLPPDRQVEFDRVIAKIRALSVERIVFNQLERLPPDLQDWVFAEEEAGVPFDVAFTNAVRRAKARAH